MGNASPDSPPLFLLPSRSARHLRMRLNEKSESVALREGAKGWKNAIFLVVSRDWLRWPRNMAAAKSIGFSSRIFPQIFLHEFRSNLSAHCSARSFPASRARARAQIIRKTTYIFAFLFLNPNVVRRNSVAGFFNSFRIAFRV